MRGLIPVFRKMHLNGEEMTWRISRGNYEWAISLNKHDHPFNPTAIYAYKARSPEGWERWILAFYPRGCGESGCAMYLFPEATDKDIFNWMTALMEKASLLDTDPEAFYDWLDETDFYIPETEELDRYEYEKPTPEMAEKLVEYLDRWLRKEKLG